MVQKHKLASNILSYTVLVLVSIIFIYPLFFLLANSLRPYFSMTPVLFFTEFHFENYYFAVAMIPFTRYLMNTIKMVLITIIGTLTFDFLFGYAFARLRAPGKNLIFKLVLLQLMIPGIAIQIPQFVFYNQLGIMNSYWVFILNAMAGGAYTIFLVKQFLTSFPLEIEEAAKMDGCSRVGIIFRIFVPLSKPLLGLLFFNGFNASWNDFMGPQMYLTSEKYPLATALFGNVYFLRNKPEVTLEPLTMAACVLFTIPVVVVFFMLQKYLVQGIVTTGIKG